MRDERDAGTKRRTTAGWWSSMYPGRFRFAWIGLRNGRTAGTTTSCDDDQHVARRPRDSAPTTAVPTRATATPSETAITGADWRVSAASPERRAQPRSPARTSARGAAHAATSAERDRRGEGANGGSGWKYERRREDRRQQASRRPRRRRVRRRSPGHTSCATHAVAGTSDDRRDVGDQDERKPPLVVRVAAIDVGGRPALRRRASSPAPKSLAAHIASRSARSAPPDDEREPEQRRQQLRGGLAAAATVGCRSSACRRRAGRRRPRQARRSAARTRSSGRGAGCGAACRAT